VGKGYRAIVTLSWRGELCEPARANDAGVVELRPPAADPAFSAFPRFNSPTH